MSLTLTNPTLGPGVVDTTKKYGKTAIRRMQAGLCRLCEAPRSPKNKSYCVPCAQKSKVYLKKRAATFKAKGLCIQCGKSEHAKHLVHCLHCWAGQVASARLGSRKHGLAILEKLEQQQYRCAYTGRHLIPGKNISLDHVIPVAQAPELAGDVDNVVWCDLSANVAKYDLSRNDFVQLCKEVVAHAGCK
jgi:hypothetical protein